MFGATMTEIVSWAYDLPETRVLEGDGLPEGAFDLIASVPGSDSVLRAVVRSVLEDRAGITTTKVIQEAEVLVLRPGGVGRRLQVSTDGPMASSSSSWRDGTLTVSNRPVESFAALLERQLGVPVLDRTGLTGRYDIEMPCSSFTVENAPDMVREATGLRLVRKTREVEYLVVKVVPELYFADAR